VYAPYISQLIAWRPFFPFSKSACRSRCVTLVSIRTARMPALSTSFVKVLLLSYKHRICHNTRTSNIWISVQITALKIVLCHPPLSPPSHVSHETSFLSDPDAQNRLEGPKWCLVIPQEYQLSLSLFFCGNVIQENREQTTGGLITKTTQHKIPSTGLLDVRKCIVEIKTK